jgi:MFS transporter, DHA2 family, multidrug resistance protein
MRARVFSNLTSPGPAASSATDGLPIPPRYWAMLTLMTGLALSCLDTAIVNVALPAIARDLKASPANSIWVINAYQLAVMISLLPFASFGDIFGYRRVYRYGLVIYTGAALISATAHSLEMLTLGRALQGLGAAGVMSVNTALVRFTYPRYQLGRGIALISLTVSTSSAAGPTVAAAILSVAPWPYLFAVNVPIGIVTLLLAGRLLPYTAPSGHRFDLISAVLCALMFGSLILGISSLGHGATAFVVIPEFGATIVTGFFLVRRQTSQEMPMLPVDLFCRPIFCALGDDLGFKLYCPGHRLRVAAVLFPERDWGVGGIDGTADDAVAGDCGSDGAAGGSARRQVSCRYPCRPRPDHVRDRVPASGLSAIVPKHTRHRLADRGLRQRNGPLPAAEFPLDYHERSA